MFNMSSPFSTFTKGDGNVASFAIAQRQANIDNAIAYIIGLYDDDIEVLEDIEIFRSIIKKYNLTNISRSEEEFIIEAVLKSVC